MSDMRKINLVAHYKAETSDKVYMACIRQNGTSWQVIGKWGRRGKFLSAQVKLTTQSLELAFKEQRNLFNTKLKEGYVDISSPSYENGLTLGSQEIRENLEPPFVPLPPVSDSAFKVSEKELKNLKWEIPENPWKMIDEEGVVAVCVRNEGIEERFDVGVEYMFEKSSDVGMLCVYDKFGEKAEFFRDRFEIRKGK